MQLFSSKKKKDIHKLNSRAKIKKKKSVVKPELGSPDFNTSAVSTQPNTNPLFFFYALHRLSFLHSLIQFIWIQHSFSNGTASALTQISLFLYLDYFKSSFSKFYASSFSIPQLFNIGSKIFFSPSNRLSAFAKRRNWIEFGSSMVQCK